ncbi:hypothetical protein ABBQ32_14122 [Trebouxia sp. C0010 RCD-2024]
MAHTGCILLCSSMASHWTVTWIFGASLNTKSKAILKPGMSNNKKVENALISTLCLPNTKVLMPRCSTTQYMQAWQYAGIVGAVTTNIPKLVQFLHQVGAAVCGFCPSSMASQPDHDVWDIRLKV